MIPALEGQSNSQIENKLTTSWLKIKKTNTNDSTEDTTQKTKDQATQTPS